jgi:hypothetical protein
VSGALMMLSGERLQYALLVLGLLQVSVTISTHGMSADEPEFGTKFGTSK